MITDIFTAQEDLPTQEQDANFWRLVHDPNNKKLVVLLILNTLRRYDSFTNEVDPVKILEKLKGFQEMIDLRHSLAGSQTDQSLPSDDPFDKNHLAVVEEQ